MLSRAERRLTIAVLGLASIVTLYPLIVLVNAALGPLHAATSGINFNHPLSLEAFGFAWREGNFSRYMLNTAIVTVAVVVISVVLSIMSGYAVAVLRPPGGRLVLYGFIFGFMLPLVMVSKQSLFVVTVGLSAFQGSHFNNYSALAAGSILAALPVIVVYFFSQRSFISGLLAGSVVE